MQAPIGGPSITPHLDVPSPAPATQLLHAARAPPGAIAATPVADKGVDATTIGLIVGLSVPILLGMGARPARHAGP
jgi:hypothetical protein